MTTDTKQLREDIQEIMLNFFEEADKNRSKLFEIEDTYLDEIMQLIAAETAKAERRGRIMEVKHWLTVYSRVSSELDKAYGTGSTTQKAVEQIIKDLSDRLAELQGDSDERLQERSDG